MNEIIKAMETRRSIRGYKEDMVLEELIADGQAVTDYTCSYQ